MKRKTFSKVTAVKAASREHIGIVPKTRLIPNKKQQKAKKSGRKKQVWLIDEVTFGELEKSS